MDSYDFVDSVKVEKANALARYKRFTNMAKLFQLIEVFVAVVLISWSSTRLPFVFKFSGEYLMAFSSCLMNQHVVFLVGNVIVVVCYVLSRHTEAGNESGGSGIYYDDHRNNHLNHQKTTVDAPKAKPVPLRVIETPVTRETAAAESQNRMIRSEKPIIQAEATETVIKQAAKQIERFQRSQSDKLKRQICRRELRRSDTERRSTTSVDGESTLTSTYFQEVDRLSNEEFRIAVEAFISKQQSLIKQQRVDENES